MSDNSDDLVESLKGLLGSTWEFKPAGQIRIVDPEGRIVLSPPAPGTFYLGKPDPIVPGNILQVIPRGAAPDRSVYIQFEYEKVCIYEQDEFNSKHLRFSIPYANINSILATANSKLLTPNEINILELIAELRSTQASLFETAEALREAKSINAISRDKEVARLQAELKVALLKSETKEKENFSLRLDKTELQKELDRINKEIEERKQALAHLELFDA